MTGNFVVYSCARTGSYHLVSLLDSCDDVVCHGELFKLGEIELRLQFNSKLLVNSPERRDAAPLKYIEQVRRLTPTKIFGFKLFFNHVTRVIILQKILLENDWKVIALYRDPIETYASLLRAEKTNIWTVEKGKRAPDAKQLNEPVRFNIESLREFADGYNWFLNRIKELSTWKPKKYFVIRYDQLNNGVVMNALLNFIGSGARFEDLKSSYMKQYSKLLHEGFENWDELCRYLRANNVFCTEPSPSICDLSGAWKRNVPS
jgi:LPS sulfotransferase NodH